MGTPHSRPGEIWTRRDGTTTISLLAQGRPVFREPTSWGQEFNGKNGAVMTAYAPWFRPGNNRGGESGYAAIGPPGKDLMGNVDAFEEGRDHKGLDRTAMHDWDGSAVAFTVPHVA